MDVYQVLKQDHEKARKLLESIAGSSERAAKTREHDFAILKTELDAHKAAEEQVFYAALRKHKETRGEALESIEEHRIVDRLLKELEAEDKSSEEWSAKLRVLKELIDHHVAEEEQEIFKEARRFLSGDDAEKMGERLLEAKKHAH